MMKKKEVVASNWMAIVWYIPSFCCFIDEGMKMSDFGYNHINQNINQHEWTYSSPCQWRSSRLRLHGSQSRPRACQYISPHQISELLMGQPKQAQASAAFRSGGPTLSWNHSSLSLWLVFSVSTAWSWRSSLVREVSIVRRSQKRWWVHSEKRIFSHGFWVSMRIQLRGKTEVT